MNALTNNTNIESMTKIITPRELMSGLKLSDSTAQNIEKWRQTTQDIIYKKDNRILTVVGPCSIHNPKEAIQYAVKLKELIKKYDNLFIVMRVYFEKPRTTVGWKGLINDPDLDGSFNIEKGLKIARKLLIEINEMGIPVSTEFLDPISPQYIGDLITWGAIGARTTESQTHRELASGLSATVGFKNGTYGDIQVAVDAIGAALEPHRFLGTTKDGETAVIETKGNKNAHIILRGGKNGTNYDIKSIEEANENLETANIKTGIMIDASHANSNKDYRNQPLVIDTVSKQIENGNKNIIGVMIESNINESKQSFTPGKDNFNELKEGVSITDACISIEETDNILNTLNKVADIKNSD